jgi:predicted phage tail protein
MAAMAKAPSAPERRQFTDAGSRTDNNAFDGLRNNITSNVPVGLNYGLNRVAGQMISGYILSRNHGKNDVVNVSESF